ncbi:hypothetical protein HDU76_001038 [Blyttiomyces sp. JEL0837]|nr:hypothetical protein HDU76_001038 [Blyttiomyces sp. JEL0837]
MDHRGVFLIACIFGHRRLAQFLVEGINNTQDINQFLDVIGVACFYKAIENGHTDIVRFLIKFNTFYTAEKCQGALHIAFRKMRREMLPLLFSLYNDNDLASSLNAIFEYACQVPCWESVVRFICECDEVTSRLDPNWKLNGIMAGIRCTDPGAVTPINELFNTEERAEACESVLECFLAPGVLQDLRDRTDENINIPKMLSVFEGVDMDLVKSMAGNKGHVRVIDFCIGLECIRIIGGVGTDIKERYKSYERVYVCEAALYVAELPGGFHDYAFDIHICYSWDILERCFEGVDADAVKRIAVVKGHERVVKMLDCRRSYWESVNNGWLPPPVQAEVRVGIGRGRGRGRGFGIGRGRGEV